VHTKTLPGSRGPPAESSDIAVGVAISLDRGSEHQGGMIVLISIIFQRQTCFLFCRGLDCRDIQSFLVTRKAWVRFLFLVLLISAPVLKFVRCIPAECSIDLSSKQVLFARAE